MQVNSIASSLARSLQTRLLPFCLSLPGFLFHLRLSPPATLQTSSMTARPAASALNQMDVVRNKRFAIMECLAQRAQELTRTTVARHLGPSTVRRGCDGCSTPVCQSQLALYGFARAPFLIINE